MATEQNDPVEAIALGELLIDFVSTVSGVDLMAAPAFLKAPGGAPANVAVGLARLGIRSGFMGQVGEDPFGHFLAQTLADAGVDISSLCFSPEARTALAFVSLQLSGERDFMFYRHPSADMLYRAADVDVARIRQAKVLHFGSISLIGEPSRSATLYAVEVARQAGLLISYDPNLRLNLWPGPETAREGIRLAWPLADVIKVSEEELIFLSGESGLQAGANRLWTPRLRLLVATCGAEGAWFFTKDQTGHAAGFPVEAVDTTGAGDAFVAGLLYGLLNTPGAFEDGIALERICRFANAVGALTTTQRGAIPALPTLAQVQAFMAAQ